MVNNSAQSNQDSGLGTGDWITGDWITGDWDTSNRTIPFSESIGSFRIAYICFDVVPAPKGAAIHIEAFATALGTLPGTLDLVTVSPDGSRLEQPTDWPGVRHIALPALGKTLIDRVLDFRRHLWQWLQEQTASATGQEHRKPFDVIQIRSIYEGYPIALNKALVCRQLFFEVNGMPSIELKYRYPKVMDDQDLMMKIIAQEDFCLAQSDRVITPSSVTRDYLIQRGISKQLIHVIPNGVDLATFTYRSPPSDPRELSDPWDLSLKSFNLLYIGTLSAWQGVELAIDAVALYCRDFPATLTIIGPARGKQDKVLMDLAAKLGVADRVTILPPMPQSELVQHMHEADAIAAPLKPNDRNLVQGCCPLKVLEGMAVGTPVITSDLPVIHDLGENNIHFLAVRPGSAKAIKDAMLRLASNQFEPVQSEPVQSRPVPYRPEHNAPEHNSPERSQPEHLQQPDPPNLSVYITEAAYRHVQSTFSWQKAQRSLLELYAILHYS